MVRQVWIAAATALVGIVAVALLVLGAFATGGTPARPTPVWLVAQPFAHRGLHDSLNRPENSLAAFEGAVQRGFGVELDVRLSSDGVPVVVHDANLERTTGVRSPVSELDAARIQALRLEGTSQHVPTLAEALAVIDGNVPVLIEVKNQGDVGPLEDAIAREIADYSGPVAVMSFNPYSVARFRTIAPGVVRGQLSSRLKGEDLAIYEKLALRLLLMNWKSRPDFIAYEVEAVPSMTTLGQRFHGRPLLLWTANTAEDTLKAQRFGDNVIANPGGLPKP